MQETIYRQNAFIIGNRVKQLKNNSVSSLLGREVTKNITRESIPLSLISYSIILFASLILLNILMTFDYSDNHLRKILHPRVFYMVKHFRYNAANRISKLQNVSAQMFPVLSEIILHFENFWNYISDKVCQVLPLQNMGFLKSISNEDSLIDTVSTSIAGLLLQIIFAFFGNTKFWMKGSQVFSWIIIVLLVLFPLKKINGTVSDLLQVTY